MQLSSPQKKVIRHSVGPGTALLAGGAIRSGKSYSSAMGLAVFCMKTPHTYDAAIVGQSVESVMRNIGFDLIDMAADLGASVSLDKQYGTRIVINGRNVWVIGASDAKARRRIQGATLCALLADEVVLMPRDFFLQAWGRLSVEGAKAWLTYNPEGPAHWFKKEVVDRLEAYDATVVDFRLDDNPTLVESVKERYEKSFTGHWRARMIDGQWAGASGLIFPRWQNCDDEPFENGTWRAAMDWGVSSVMHAVVASVSGTQLRVLGEFRHDAVKEGVWTEQESVDAISGFLGAKNAHRMPLYVDPSTPQSVKRLLRLKGLRVMDANNDVLSGLSRVAESLGNGETQVCRARCPALVDEMLSYQWDDAKTDLGQDAPVKSNDHGCDALRYLVHSVGWTRGRARQTTVARAMR